MSEAKFEHGTDYPKFNYGAVVASWGRSTQQPALCHSHGADTSAVLSEDN